MYLLGGESGVEGMLLSLIKREFKRFILKDPRILIFIFGAPLGYMTLFGFLYRQDVVKYVPTVVYDQDQTPLSRSLSQAFADSEKFSVVGYVSSQEEMDAHLREQEAITAIVIPPKFAQNVKRGTSSQVLVEVNNDNMTIGNIVMIAAQEIAQEFSNSAGKFLLEETGQLPWTAQHKVAPIETRIYVLNNPTLSYSYFFLLGLVVTALQAGILLALCCTIVYEFDPEIMQEVKELGAWQLLMSKFMVYVFLAICSFAVAMVSTVYFFHIPFKGALWDLFVIGGAFAVAVVPLSGVLAAFSRNEVDYTQLALAIAMPSFIFSGYLWPLEAMNGFSQAMAKIFPVTYAADTVRDIMIGGFSPTLYHNSFMLVMGGVLFYIIAVALFVRRRKRLYAGQA